MGTAEVVIITDTSVWVELLRGTGDQTAMALKGLISRGKDVRVPDIVFMELLAGASSEIQARDLQGRLMSFPVVQLRGLADFESAASLYRACRRAGETIRKMTDCLVSIAAMRIGGHLLHKDRDFDAIARHSPLQIYQL
ncbi:MAG: PIN domain nuclease [Actinomycetota bacterium]|nr:PIN domain nuclease [Actinomycetota bacterium]